MHYMDVEDSAPEGVGEMPVNTDVQIRNNDWNWKSPFDRLCGAVYLNGHKYAVFIVETDSGIISVSTLCIDFCVIPSYLDLLCAQCTKHKIQNEKVNAQNNENLPIKFVVLTGKSQTGKSTHRQIYKTNYNRSTNSQQMLFYKFMDS